jgi:hypothetical protein
MKSNSVIRRTTTLLLVSIGLLGVTQTALAAAGKVLFVSGSVSLERNGTRTLKVGDPLDLGDTVVTGEQSRAQILMADGARIALRASSRFRIDELALPSNVQQPGMAVAVASAGKSVGTLLKGGFSTRDGAVGKSNPSGYEMRTPVGTLGIRGTYYTAVLCRGDCTDAPGQPAGQPIADGLYLAIDEGAITFNGRGLNLTLTAPAVEFIPLETGDPQQLANPPAFLRNDAAGPLAAAGRPLVIASVSAPPTEISDRREPGDAGGPGTAAGPIRNIKSASSGAASDTPGDTADKSAADVAPDRSIVATTPLGRPVDLLDPQLVPDPQVSVATAVPQAGAPSFAASSTQLSTTRIVNAMGSVVQFDAPVAPGVAAATGTYASGTAALVDNGSNGASGLRWGRWSTGVASVIAPGGNNTLTLGNASLHWITGPNFELVPMLPVSGTTNFVLAGGTSPTDTLGHIGSLNTGVLSADFTAQQVSTIFSLDINGYNWLASGTAPIIGSSVRFGGPLSSVVIDGRIAGAGEISGFFSAGAATPDQINGVGLSYALADLTQQLGFVSGVAAFVPGTGQTPQPVTVSRDVAFSVGDLGNQLPATSAASNTLAQLAVDGSGNLTSFFAPVPAFGSGTLALSTSTNANVGADAATGLSWGRWQGGNASLNVPPGPAGSIDLSTQALHWIAGSSYGAVPVLPQIGTASYVLIGNTDPTDTLGNIGTLGAASLSADFTARTVDTALSLTMAGHNWYATGAGTFAANSALITGDLTQVSVDNLLSGSGSYAGFFTVPRIGAGTAPGAGLSYSMNVTPAGLGQVSGVLAFAAGNGNPVPAPQLGARDIGWLIPFEGYGDSRVETKPETEYTLGATFDLTGLQAPNNQDSQSTFTLGTSVVAESNADPITMLRWGRWSTGSASELNVDGTLTALDLSQRSLHWVEGSDSVAPPVLPTTGFATFTLAGGTAPTDRVGNVGTLNSATLTADFLYQQVSTSLDITINGGTWTATGQGPIGAQAGVANHQFAGAITGGSISALGGMAPTGSFSGFFTNPGGAPGSLPTGAGMTYSLNDAQGTYLNDGAFSVDGVAVFRQP